jgi:hypothetical protein
MRPYKGNKIKEMEYVELHKARVKVAFWDFELEKEIILEGVVEEVDENAVV